MGKGYTKILFLGIAFLTISVLAFYAASLIINDATLQAQVQRLGYAGMLLTAFFSGLNIFIPIHAATFAPIFLSAGYSYLAIIICFALGTTLADSVGYLIGKVGRHYTNEHQPKVVQKMNRFFATHQKWILPGAYIYMAFAPLPNEYIMVPLALAGYKYRHLLLPLLLGNFIHHSLIVFGYVSLFSWLFG